MTGLLRFRQVVVHRAVACFLSHCGCNSRWRGCGMACRSSADPTTQTSSRTKEELSGKDAKWSASSTTTGSGTRRGSTGSGTRRAGAWPRGAPKLKMHIDLPPSFALPNCRIFQITKDAYRSSPLIRTNKLPHVTTIRTHIRTNQHTATIHRCRYHNTEYISRTNQNIRM